MLTLLTVAGGVALILFAVRYLRTGLDRLFGPRLNAWLQRAANNRIRAFLSGIGLAILTPSSTTISVLTVQSVQSGQLTVAQTLSIMLGANIGLTVMVQLISLRLEQFSPILLLAGVCMYMVGRSSWWRGFGQVVLSLGFLFLAIQIIKAAVAPLTDNLSPDSEFGTLISLLENHPVGLTLFAAVLTAVLQSSTATLGMIIGLAAAGGSSLDIALPAVLGANLGLGVTTLAVGWVQHESRTMAAANLLLKIAVAVAILWLLPWLMPLVEQSPGTQANHVANVHTAFNLLVALIGLPLVGPVARLIRFVLPPPPTRPTFGPRHISRSMPDSVTLALGQSLREIMHCAEIVQSMLADLWRGLRDNDENLIQDVIARDDKVDLLDQEIKRFLTRVGAQETELSETHEQLRQLRYLTELEAIGDIIDKNLCDLALKKMRLGAEFTTEERQELDRFYHMVAENVQIADTAFTTRDRLLAQQLLRHKERLGDYERELRDRHFVRLSRQPTSDFETSAIYLDLLTHLKRINSSVTHVAYAVLESDRKD